MAAGGPRVSVLMGTFNRAHLLPRAVHSVFRQEYADWEVILVDDASTDNTREIVAQIADRRVKYLRQDRNRGIAAVLNTAFHAGAGQYLAFLDDDDEWTDRQKLHKQVQVFESAQGRHVGIVSAWWREVANGRVVRRCAPRPPRDWTQRILMGNGIVATSPTMVSREAWAAVGGFDESLKRGTHSELFRCMIARGFGVHFIPEFMADVEVGSADRMTRADTAERLAVCRETVEYLLRKHAALYRRYPAARGVRYYQLADLALRKYLIGGDKGDLSLFDVYTKRGLQCKMLPKPILKWLLCKVLGPRHLAALRNAVRPAS